MKKLFLKIFLFAATVVILMTVFLHFYGGVVDHFYGKFTTPKQHSLIIGESKSFMGIRPEVMTDQLASQYQLPMYNYAFTIAQTAYGDLLLESTLRKIAPGTTNGLFILSVSPWVLAERTEDDVDNGVFFERDVPPNNMYFPAMNPNPEYVVKNFESFNFKGVFRQISTLEENGWQNVKNITADPEEIKRLNKVNEDWFLAKSQQWRKSDYRLRKFAETVSALQRFGTVVIIRMPSSKPVMAVENSFWADLDTQMHSISKTTGAQYVNFTVGYQFPTFDGVHFDHATSVAFTRSLCDSIVKKPLAVIQRNAK